MKPYQLTHKDGTEGTPAAIVWLAVLSFVVCITVTAPLWVRYVLR